MKKDYEINEKYLGFSFISLFSFIS